MKWRVVMKKQLLECSECSGTPGVNDCDIRGILPRFEHIPIDTQSTLWVFGDEMFWILS